MDDSEALDAYSASIVRVVDAVLPSVSSSSPSATPSGRWCCPTVVTTTAVQRLMVGDAIGRRTEVTVWRNGALVDAVVLPQELVTAP